MLVTDADGVILWREGAAAVLHAADGVGPVPRAPGGARTPSAPTRWAPRWPSTPRCRSTPPSTWCAPTTPGPAPPRRCTTRTPARSSAPSTSPARCTRVHPAMVQLVSATAQLAEHQLRVRLAIADERLRVRNMPHLTSLRGQAGALVTPSGRIIAGEPYGDWPERVAAAGRRRPRPARRRPRDGGRAAGRGLPAARRRSAPRRRPGAARSSLRFMGDGAPTAVLNGRPDPAHAAARPSCSPRSPCTPTG